LGWVLSLAIGAVLWTTVAMATGQREPWDSGLYWSAAYPLALLAAGVLGAQFPHRPWRWALALTFVQLPVMLLGGSGLGLLPLGVIALAVLAVPPIAVAKLGGWLRSVLAA
jgi:hypothetical protein